MKTVGVYLLCLIAVLGFSGCQSSQKSVTKGSSDVGTKKNEKEIGATTAAPARILVFSKTKGFRHDSIASGQQALITLGEQANWRLSFTEDARAFSKEGLGRYAVVVFLNTTGDVLDDEQQTAFEHYIATGGGFVGVHSASDTEHDWPWYGQLVGAQFNSHPEVQQARLVVEDNDQLATEHLNDAWLHSDEWYNFNRNPRKDVDVLLSLDEHSYDAGPGAMGDHPIAWQHHVEQGRAFFTGLGHTKESYQSPEFLQHLSGGIHWAAGIDN
ncbi:ThuA domain-containing protein [Thalassotalea litorea]|uniref:ThuA domain-containing protein n=1 Tax=Thalassotalea litorea TaxID=2020715 RepID=A0A5R9IWK7_9GAMM|nr:ThuA domain-containing protein [Thalassotalea litorea]TLU67556.1 ThuA domain-containing protein [Thalassotalea litorea]